MIWMFGVFLMYSSLDRLAILPGIQNPVWSIIFSKLYPNIVRCGFFFLRLSLRQYQFSERRQRPFVLSIEHLPIPVLRAASAASCMYASTQYLLSVIPVLRAASAANLTMLGQQGCYGFCYGFRAVTV